MIRRGRARFTLLVFAGLILAAAFIPLPHRIVAPLWLEPEDAQSIYVAVPGILRDALPAGSAVQAGDSLATLENAELALQAADAAREAAEHELRLKNLRLLQADDPSVGPQIPAAEKALESAREVLQQRQADLARLQFRAPQSGTVLSPPLTPATAFGEKYLPGLHGTPLDAANRGCFLEAGSLLCLVGDPQRLEAMLVIEQADVPFVRVGQLVRLWVAQGPVRQLRGTITELAKTDADDLPAPLSRALDLPLSPGNATGPQTTATYYQARVQLTASSSAAPLLPGMHGHARISADWQPLLVRVWRYLQRTFGGA